MNTVFSGFYAACFILGTAVCSTRCMYTLPGQDIFADSEWKSDEVPLGPLNVSSLDLQFEDDGKVKIELILYGADDSAADDDSDVEVLVVDGEYSHNDGIAIFSSFSIVVDGVAVTFVEADWGNEDVLFLLWRAEDILHPFTTPLQRIN